MNAGHLGEANEWLRRGFDLVENHNERCLESELLRLRGELLARTPGGESGAEACFEEAVRAARRQEARSRELRAVMSLCLLERKTGRPGGARQRLTEVLGRFTEGLTTSDLVRAKALLRELEPSRAV